MKKYLKFEADWCNPCKQMDKVLKDSGLPVQHLNVDDTENESIVSLYKIKSLPTLVLVENDIEITRFIGITSIDKLKEAYEVN